MQPTETESLKLGQNRNRRPIFESETPKGYFVAPACQSSSFQRRGSLLFC
jgi:hypothetical protein